MQYYPAYQAARPRSQAIPMAVYRRQLFVAQWRPRILLLLFAFAMYPVASSPWVSSRPYDYSFPFGPLPFGPGVGTGERGIVTRQVVADLRPELAVVESGEQVGGDLAEGDGSVAPIASGLVQIRGAGYATTTNVAIAISFIDGLVIQPGAKFSFDDAARTWDYREDSRYIPGPATSARGLITMRGGGVCWLSTALWRAALAAGLRTEVRENHYGFVPALGGGLDATNTLVIRNDSEVPVTVRAWMDQDEVYVALYADGSLGRSSTVRGPERLSSGRYVAYQDIAWGDGTSTTNEFMSRYNW